MEYEQGSPFVLFENDVEVGLDTDGISFECGKLVCVIRLPDSSSTNLNNYSAVR
jgi:hypothetical protein